MTQNLMQPNTPLIQLGLPHLDVVLAERFLLPPDSLRRFNMPIPQTIEDLCEASGMPLDEVSSILSECLALDKQVWLSGDIEEFTDRDGTWLVDMRPNVDYDMDPIHPKARIFHHGNQVAQLQLMRELKCVIVLSGSEAHAWSAAMALRSMNVPAFVLRVKATN